MDCKEQPWLEQKMETEAWFLQVRGGNEGSSGKCSSELSFEEMEDACVWGCQPDIKLSIT